jgi:hypothetical protein
MKVSGKKSDSRLIRLALARKVTHRKVISTVAVARVVAADLNAAITMAAAEEIVTVVEDLRANIAITVAVDTMNHVNHVAKTQTAAENTNQVG